MSLPLCANCDHAGTIHNWRVPPCTLKHDKDIPCANCLRQKELRRVRGACLFSNCRCSRYVPDTDQPMPVNSRIARLARNHPRR